MSEALRVDDTFHEAQRMLARQEDIWKQLADPLKKLTDETVLELTREYRELEEKLRGAT